MQYASLDENIIQKSLCKRTFSEWEKGENNGKIKKDKLKKQSFLPSIFLACFGQITSPDEVEEV